jgi:hypothetical protein
MARTKLTYLATGVDTNPAYVVDSVANKAVYLSGLDANLGTKIIDMGGTPLNGLSSTIYGYVKSNFSTGQKEVLWYLLSNIPDSVLYYTDDGRSDIMVFIVLIAYLFGNQRDRLASWSSYNDIEKLYKEKNGYELVKKLSGIAGYTWLDGYDEKQQIIMVRDYMSILKIKGTADAFRSVIRLCSYSRSYQNNPFVEDNSSGSLIKVIDVNELSGGGVSIKIPSSDVMTYKNSKDESYNFVNDYLYKQLEKVRPVGVWYTFGSSSVVDDLVSYTDYLNLYDTAKYEIGPNSVTSNGRIAYSTLAITNVWNVPMSTVVVYDDDSNTEGFASNSLSNLTVDILTRGLSGFSTAESAS